MAQFVITGGKKLEGEVEVGGAKNSILTLIPASILCDGVVRISNVPAIEDVKRMNELMRYLGASIEEPDIHSLMIDTRKIQNSHIHDDLAKRLRASILLTGPLLARFGEVSFPHPGGCVIGQRPIDLFIDGFKSLGATIEEHLDGKYPSYKISGKKLRGNEYTFKNMSVTGTECLMMLATLIKGKTILRNAALEPEVSALAEFLNHCGAKIEGAGTPTITITGVTKLTGGVSHVIPDRIDASSFAILAAATRSHLTIKHIIPEHSMVVVENLRSMGVGVSIEKNMIKIIPQKNLKAVNLKTHEYPGFPTDLQAPFTVLATSAEGQSLIHETVYEGRLFYIESLNRMGASITMCDPHRIIVNGPTKLHGRDMESPDIRAGLAFIIAALMAKGTSTIDDIYPIERGYENVEKRLQAIGADIKRVGDVMPLSHTVPLKK